jgi:hypothetical protein
MAMIRFFLGEIERRKLSARHGLIKHRPSTSGIIITKKNNIHSTSIFSLKNYEHIDLLHGRDDKFLRVGIGLCDYLQRSNLH